MNPYQIVWNGLTMGDGTPYVVQGMNLNTAPDLRLADTVRGRRHGSRLGRDFVAARIITADILIGTDNPADGIYQAFVDACVPGAELDRTLAGYVPGVADSQPWQVDCRLRRRSLPTDQDFAAGYGVATVEWHAGDPRIYGADLQSLETVMADASAGGAAFPWSFPLSFGTAISSGTVNATNTGNFPVPWRARIYGPCSNPHIEVVGFDVRLELATTLAAGEWVELDSDRGSVMYLGTAARRNWLGTFSRWFDLPAGTTALRFGAASADVGARLALDFRPGWV